jgi:phage head maturation protease
MNDLNMQREAVLAAKMNGVVGGVKVLWDTKSAAQLRRDIWALPERVLFAAAEVKTAARPMAAPAPVLRAMDSGALSWQFKITDQSPDLMNDLINVDGWDLANCARNLPVLFNHDPSMPVGQSSMPWKSGQALMAIVTFPTEGVSATSDQCRSMVAAGVLRGASVGFVPGKFRLSSDAQRPMGIDFLSGHRLSEWSCVSCPANQNCLVVGPASSSKSAATSSAASRPMSRAARMAEAREFRRRANAVR